MYEIKISKKADSKIIKFSKKDKNLGQLIQKTISLLSKDPSAPSLKSHRVVNALGEKCWSSRVNGNIRILWSYSATEIYVILVIDLGGHSGKHKVYN